MGEIAEMHLDGTLCEQCGVFLGDPVGYPQYCSNCENDDDSGEEIKFVWELMITLEEASFCYVNAEGSHPSNEEMRKFSKKESILTEKIDGDLVVNFASLPLELKNKKQTYKFKIKILKKRKQK